MVTDVAKTPTETKEESVSQFDIKEPDFGTSAEEIADDKDFLASEDDGELNEIYEKAKDKGNGKAKQEDTEPDQDVDEPDPHVEDIDEPETPDESETADMDEPEAPVSHSGDLIQRARDLGMSMEEINSFPDSQGLDLFVAKFERKQSDVESSKSDAKPKDDKPDLMKKLDEVDVDAYEGSEIVLPMIGLIKEQHKVISKLEKSVQTLEENHSYEQQAQFETEFDGMITGLGESHKDLFGEGKSGDLKPRSMARRNRTEVLEEMAITMQGYKAVGKPIPSSKVLFERSVRALFPNIQKTIAEQKVASKLKKRSTQISQKPTHKKSTEPDGVAKATRNLNAKMRESDGTEGVEDIL